MLAMALTVTIANYVMNFHIYTSESDLIILRSLDDGIAFALI
jgi:hypothetical protein